MGHLVTLPAKPASWVLVPSHCPDDKAEVQRPEELDQSSLASKRGVRGGPALPCPASHMEVGV